RLYDKKQDFEVLCEEKAEKLVIDGHYDVFRKLTPEETPPVIGRLLNPDKGLIVLPSEGKGDIYSWVVRYFEERGYEAKKSQEVGDEDVKRSPLVILGYDNPVIRRLFGKMDGPSQGLVLTVRQNPFDPSMIIGVVNASSGSEVESAWEKISHFGNSGLVAFKEGKNIEKKTGESQQGWDIPLAEPVVGIEVAKTRKLSDIVNSVSGKRVVYVGEHHTSYAHHLTQLETIRGLFRKDPKIAIGMEMFQKPFQQVLDEYIEGTIDEKEFLKSSEYFSRWGFEYTLYRDILTFAREEKIPVVALNIRKEIVDKVSSKGMDSLSDEEKNELPDTMDMSDEEYRERLREVFEQHERSGSRDFDNFYQSQIIWDETMAQSIDEYLRKNPERKMVVIAGSGHLAYKSGIPKRVFRRNGLEYAVLLNDDAVETGVADFVLFPHPANMVSAPKLMVLLSEEEGRVKVKGFPDKSVSEKAGLQKGDVILSLDNELIKGADDIKIFLFYKKQGDTIEVRVLRKRFLFGDREISVKVTL
ncbi:MAG TPA: ChaN family lipoprotein, partial [Thermodesulfovibrionales bacterium]|nr:ChaN family lipoprotein [Thermodesulfovibrionales bacterium]